MAASSLSAKPLDVVVVGQTPPPYHGQAIMIQRLLDGRFERLRLHPVRMAFSRDIEEIGRAGARKVVHLGEVIARIAAVRAKTGAQVLYYPPAGLHRAPIYRDIAVLLAVRPWFRSTVYHFHAGGLEAPVGRLSGPERALFHRALDRPQCAILLSSLNPPDGDFVGARSQRVIPYGIEDVAGRNVLREAQGDMPTILSVGIIRESKGALVTLRACAALRKQGLRFRLKMMGAFASPELEHRVRNYVRDNGLTDVVELLGVLTGDDKWRAFASADVLCFPTFYELETFGLVLLEAMQFALPVVATTWRAVPSIVEDGRTGILVPPRDAAACASALATLLSDASLRRRMGAAGRARFLEHFTIDRWYRRMQDALVDSVAMAGEAAQ